MLHRATFLNILLTLLIVLMTARFIASVATSTMARRSGTPAPLPSVGRSQDTPGSPVQPQEFGIILEKGLFGPSTRGVLSLAPQTAGTPSPTPRQDLTLLGTAVLPAGGGFILVRNNSTGEERVFRVGEKVFATGTLAAVRKESAELGSGAQSITLRTPASPADAAPPRSGPPPVTGANTGAMPPMAGGNGVIDRRALHAALENISQAMTDARLIPSSREGKIEGFRISEVRPQGVFSAVGLKNGDILVRINDFPVDSPERAVQSFLALKGFNQIRLDLIRDGVPTSLSYAVH